VSFQGVYKILRTALLGSSLLACAPAPPQQFNSLAFARRAPAAGAPGYWQTIRYIDDGLKYVDPASAFFVSPDGRMCFRGVLNANRTAPQYLDDWCLAPAAVSRVEAMWNDVTGIPELQLWCRHANPECVRNFEYPTGTTNLVIVQIVPSGEEKAAVEHLIHLMGGNLGEDEPFAGYSSASGYLQPIGLVQAPPR
jgi:hypothetical protein